MLAIENICYKSIGILSFKYYFQSEDKLFIAVQQIEYFGFYQLERSGIKVI